MSWLTIRDLQSRPHLVAKAWSTALLQEWSVQAKIEEEFKLPVSVMILNPAEAQAQAKSQVGFINLFTQPLFDAMASTLPGQSILLFISSCPLNKTLTLFFTDRL